MKKLILTILILFCATMAYSIPDNLPEKIEKMLPWTRLELPTETGNSGEITVFNIEDKVKDKIRIYNTTSISLDVTIKGLHQEKGLILISSGSIAAYDSRYFNSKWEDSLYEFNKFYISIEGGKITKHYAEVGSSDMLFHIYETDINSLSPADELAKWKKLLDDGAITQKEYNAKKKQLLGL